MKYENLKPECFSFFWGPGKLLPQISEGFKGNPEISEGESCVYTFTWIQKNPRVKKVEYRNEVFGA